MNALVVFIILFVGLFLLAYLTKRRFGVLGLALCAGTLLSTSWTTSLTPWIQQQGIEFVSPPLSAVVSTVLIMLPPVLLLFGGPTYSGKWQRIAGASAFALLAFVFLLTPIGEGLLFDPVGYRMYTFLSSYSNVITVAGIAGALGDMLLTRSPHHARRPSH